MLLVKRRTMVEVGESYDISVLSSGETLWVRLGMVDSGDLVRVWSRTADLNASSAADQLVEDLKALIKSADPHARRTQAAFNIWPKGWDMWPGLPAPISKEIRDPSFLALLRSHPADD